MKKMLIAFKRFRDKLLSNDKLKIIIRTKDGISIHKTLSFVKTFSKNIIHFKIL